MPKKDSVKLLRRSQMWLYSRIGDHLLEWSWRQHKWGMWTPKLVRAWLQPGRAVRPMMDAREVTIMPSKPVSGGSDCVPTLPSADYGAWRVSFPALASWLCDANWAEGGPMGKTRLSMTRDGTEIRVVLQVADFGGLRAECSGPTPDAALKMLESLVKSDKAPWQLDPYPIGQMGKKAKK